MLKPIGNGGTETLPAQQAGAQPEGLKRLHELRIGIFTFAAPLLSQGVYRSVKQLDGMLPFVATYFADLIEQSGLVELTCTFISAFLHHEVFGSGFVAHRLHPPCIQGVIFEPAFGLFP